MERLTMRKQVRLLVVDDHVEFCDLVKEIVDLSTHVFEITCEFATDKASARNLMKSFEPSVVLLDAHLEGGNSLQCLEDWKHLPAQVVVTSVSNSPAIEKAARTGGASGYCPKSNKIEDVERLVHELAEMAGDSYRIH